MTSRYCCGSPSKALSTSIVCSFVSIISGLPSLVDEVAAIGARPGSFVGVTAGLRFFDSSVRGAYATTSGFRSDNRLRCTRLGRGTCEACVFADCALGNDQSSSSPNVAMASLRNPNAWHPVNDTGIAQQEAIQSATTPLLADELGTRHFFEMDNEPLWIGSYSFFTLSLRVFWLNAFGRP
jgi:hypothetical protein